jgi:hypothetical protein
MGTRENMTKVMLLTDAYRITGYIDLVPGARVTDFMQEARQFVAVMDAEVYEVMVAPFIDVNRDRIEIITPA